MVLELCTCWWEMAKSYRCSRRDFALGEVEINTVLRPLFYSKILVADITLPNSVPLSFLKAVILFALHEFK